MHIKWSKQCKNTNKFTNTIAQHDFAKNIDSLLVLGHHPAIQVHEVN